MERLYECQHIRWNQWNISGVEKYWINEKLAKQIIIEDLRNNDTKLISKLLANKSINETYVQDIDGYKIFDKESLISLLRYKITGKIAILSMLIKLV